MVSNTRQIGIKDTANFEGTFAYGKMFYNTKFHFLLMSCWYYRAIGPQVFDGACQSGSPPFDSGDVSVPQTSLVVNYADIEEGFEFGAARENF